MGQRLNIEIVYKREENMEDEVVLANAYYHWSAYTLSANDLVLKIIEKLEKDDVHIDQIKDKRLYAIRLLEETGALVANEDYDAILPVYPNEEFKKAVSRNDGLIGFLPASIKTTRDWEEGKMTIYLDDLTVNSGCHCEYDDEESFRDSYGYEDREEYPDEIPTSTFQTYTGDLSFADFREFNKLCEEAGQNEYGAMLLENGTVIALIQ